MLANEVMHQPQGSVTLLTGFRFAIGVYTTINGIVSIELAYGMSTLPWPDQRLLMRDCLVAAKAIVNDLPPELQLGHLGDEADSLAGLDEAGLQYVPPLWPEPQPPHDLRNVIKAQPLRRRQLQYEMQKANLAVSQLATRSYIVHLFFTLRDVHLSEQQQQQQEDQQQDPQDQQEGDEVEAGLAEIKALQDADDKEILDLMCAERELLVQNLLTILGSVSQRNLEPNGGALVGKIRQVALTLLGDAPERKGPFAIKADEALSQLVDVLARLDRSGAAAAAAADAGQMMTAEDEAEELRHWADLRDFQLRYAADGVFGDQL